MVRRRSRFLPRARAWAEALPQDPRGSSSPRRAGLDTFALRLWLGSLVLGSALAVGPAEAATFVVNTINDGPDAVLDGTCATTAPPRCTLRAAIEEANFAVGPTTINFSINPAGPKTIVLGSALPPITKVVIIDGTTQPGWVNAPPYAPVIQLNGAAGGNNTLDLRAGGSGSTIRGLCINRSPGNAIRMLGSSNNVIAGNFLGTNLAGTAVGPGNVVGVYIGGSATPTNNNLIGGTNPADRNLLSGNLVDGIQINGGSGGAANNLVRGNYIGVDVTGTLDVGNTNQGVAVFGTSNTNNVIGGTALGAGNVISGNNGTGVLIGDAGTTLTLVQGNKIGTNAAGTASLGNGQHGVIIVNAAASNTVGGTTVPARNVISGNGGQGVRIDALNTNNNVVAGNFIGTNAAGTAGIGNSSGGIAITNSPANNTIGGAAAGAGNRDRLQHHLRDQRGGGSGHRQLDPGQRHLFEQRSGH